MQINLIVAASENNVIGVKGALPWHISEDLKRFKALTTGQVVVMGRKTFDSLPVKPLPNRRNIVLTRDVTYRAVGADVFRSMANVLAALENDKVDTLFIMGGGEIYRQTLPIAHRVYLTRVHTTIDGDTTFPPIPPAFREIERTDHLDHTPPYSFITYERKKR